MNDSKEALYDIGATGNVHPGFHGSWAFVGYTGPEQVKWAKTVSLPRHKGPAVIEEMITSPSADAEISKIFTSPVLLRSTIEAEIRITEVGIIRLLSVLWRPKYVSYLLFQYQLVHKGRVKEVIKLFQRRDSYSAVQYSLEQGRSLRAGIGIYLLRY